MSLRIFPDANICAAAKFDMDRNKKDRHKFESRD